MNEHWSVSVVEAMTGEKVQGIERELMSDIGFELEKEIDRELIESLSLSQKTEAPALWPKEK